MTTSGTDNLTFTNTESDNQTFVTISSATLTNYYEATATGAAAATKQTSAATLTDNTDISFSNPIFVDSAGNPVSWITAGSTSGYKVVANSTGVARTATIAFIVNGKLVKTDKTITQNA